MVSAAIFKRELKPFKQDVLTRFNMFMLVGFTILSFNLDYLPTG